MSKRTRDLRVLQEWADEQNIIITLESQTVTLRVITSEDCVECYSLVLDDYPEMTICTGPGDQTKIYQGKALINIAEIIIGADQETSSVEEENGSPLDIIQVDPRYQYDISHYPYPCRDELLYHNLSEIKLTLIVSIEGLVPIITAKAWGLEGVTIFEITLTFPSPDYYDVIFPPKVSVLGNFRLAPLFQRILHRYLEAHWLSKDFGPEGLLSGLVADLTSRVPTLHRRCILCDDEHLFDNHHATRPYVCTRPVCQFMSQQMAAISTHDLELSFEVFDLLFNLLSTVAYSPRAADVFVPFPLIFDRDHRNQLILDPGKPNHQLVQDILTSLPPMEILREAYHHPEEFKALITSCHPYAYPLIHWTMTSNQTQLTLLNDEQRVPSMKTPYQYVMLSASPEKEAAFRVLKSEYGSVFGYHGSSEANWYSIVRTGLRNASGTKLQLNGAAYGPGVYISSSLAYSINYSRNLHAQRLSPKKKEETVVDGLLPSTWHCIALCEYIKTDQVREHANIKVVPEESHVCTRFLFCFTEDTLPVEERDALDPTFHQEIERLCMDLNI